MKPRPPERNPRNQGRPHSAIQAAANHPLHEGSEALDELLGCRIIACSGLSQQPVKLSQINGHASGPSSHEISFYKVITIERVPRSKEIMVIFLGIWHISGNKRLGRQELSFSVSGQ
jgi:hypothetical protein